MKAKKEQVIKKPAKVQQKVTNCDGFFAYFKPQDLVWLSDRSFKDKMVKEIAMLDISSSDLSGEYTVDEAIEQIGMLPRAVGKRFVADLILSLDKVHASSSFAARVCINYDWAWFMYCLHYGHFNATICGYDKEDAARGVRELYPNEYAQLLYSKGSEPEPSKLNEELSRIKKSYLRQDTYIMKLENELRDFHSEVFETSRKLANFGDTLKTSDAEKILDDISKISERLVDREVVSSNMFAMRKNLLSDSDASLITNSIAFSYGSPFTKSGKRPAKIELPPKEVVEVIREIIVEDSEQDDFERYINEEAHKEHVSKWERKLMKHELIDYTYNAMLRDVFGDIPATKAFRLVTNHYKRILYQKPKPVDKEKSVKPDVKGDENQPKKTFAPSVQNTEAIPDYMGGGYSFGFVNPY